MKATIILLVGIPVLILIYVAVAKIIREIFRKQ
jgi:hypothetical protein